MRWMNFCWVIKPKHIETILGLTKLWKIINEIIMKNPKIQRLASKFTPIFIYIYVELS